MELNKLETTEKRRVPKSAKLILLAEIFERYSSGGISCELHKLIRQIGNKFYLDIKNYRISENVYGIALLAPNVIDGTLSNFGTLFFLLWCYCGNYHFNTNEFAFNFSILSAVLLLFINLKLGYDEDTTTAIYHSYEYEWLTYFFAVLGAIIADSWLGLYKTIICAEVIFAAGCILLAIGVIDVLNLPIYVLSFIGLLVITVGIGSLKPLTGTYGAQQYKPNEVKNIALFFFIYYFTTNCGSMISQFVSPILRQDVKCFRNNDCFSLAFGIPAGFLVLVVLLIMIANRYSETSQAKGTTLLNVFACITYAIVMKIKSRKPVNSKKNHWLDYAVDKYGETLVSETRILRILVLYLPIPIFWALFFQQGSRWVFQAVRMNGDLGFYTIKPDQFNVVNPILCLLLIPTFEYVFYPLLAKVGIKNALQKTTLGGILAGIAFLIAAVIESQIDGNYLHMAWLLPQYLVMAMAEILIQVTLMHFTFSEAPKSMKAILQSFRMLAIGAGNLIVVIVAGAKLLDQIYEFILFAGLMFVDMIIFGFLASRYKPLKLNEDDQIENESQDYSKTI